MHAKMADLQAFRSSRNIFVDVPRRVIWGLAPTGEPHFGYVLPVLVLKRLRTLGSDIVPLIANWHGYLDSGKTAWSAISTRTYAYRRWLSAVGFPEVIETNEFYKKADYVQLLFKSSPYFSLTDILNASRTTLRSERGSETVAETLYTLTQIIDLAYLNIDCALCGEDEAQIYEFGMPILAQKLGHLCSGVYVHMAPGLLEDEMHASSPTPNKLMLSDDEETIERKIQNHVDHLPPGTEADPLASFLVGPIAEMMPPCEEIETLRTLPAGHKALSEALVRAVKRVFGEIGA